MKIDKQVTDKLVSATTTNIALASHLILRIKCMITQWRTSMLTYVHTDLKYVMLIILHRRDES